MGRTAHLFTLDDPAAAPYLAAYFPLADPLVPLERLAAYIAVGANGVVIGSKTVQKAMRGQAVPGDYLNEMRAVLNGG